jgi:putative transcriptional regulator
MKNRVKVLRAEHNLTQADLANAVQVSRQTINAIEKGKFDPSLDLAFKLSIYFSTKIEEMFEYGK